MILEFVEKFDKNRAELKDMFVAKHPYNYKEIVKNVITVISKDEAYHFPDPERIHQIDDGEYQGTLVFVIAAKGYQPSEYWSVMVSYGSCSGCDTLEGINDGCDDDTPTEEQVEQYMALAVHILQGLKEMNSEIV